MPDRDADAPLHFVLVRGLSREACHWGELPALLRTHFAGSRVSCLDLPGAGIKHQQTSPLRVGHMVESLRMDFRQAAQPGETAVLLAISLGGMIAAHWMQHYPDDFARAVLINTSFGDISPLHQRLRPAAFPALVRVLLTPRHERESVILGLVSNHVDARSRALPHWNRIRSERPMTLHNTARQMWAAARFRLGNFVPRVPVLLLAATRDRMVSVECSRAIARRWQVPVREHPSAGHDLPLDDPAWVVDSLVAWLDKNGG